jgi:hypothetical protein
MMPARCWGGIATIAARAVTVPVRAGDGVGVVVDGADLRSQNDTELFGHLHRDLLGARGEPVLRARRRHRASGPAAGRLT